jgi:hypothetical protein
MTNSKSCDHLLPLGLLPSSLISRDLAPACSTPGSLRTPSTNRRLKSSVNHLPAHRAVPYLDDILAPTTELWASLVQPADLPDRQLGAAGSFALLCLPADRVRPGDRDHVPRRGHPLDPSRLAGRGFRGPLEPALDDDCSEFLPRVAGLIAACVSFSRTGLAGLPRRICCLCRKPVLLSG